VSGVATFPDTSQHFVIATGRKGPINRNDVWTLNITAESLPGWVLVEAEGDVPVKRYGSSGGIADGDSVLLLTHGFSDTKRFSDAYSLDLSEASPRWRKLRRQVAPYTPSHPHSRCIAAGTVLSLADSNGEEAAEQTTQESI